MRHVFREGVLKTKSHPKIHTITPEIHKNHTLKYTQSHLKYKRITPEMHTVTPEIHKSHLKYRRMTPEIHKNHTLKHKFGASRHNCRKP